MKKSQKKNKEELIKARATMTTVIEVLTPKRDDMDIEMVKANILENLSTIVFKTLQENIKDWGITVIPIAIKTTDPREQIIISDIKLSNN